LEGAIACFLCRELLSFEDCSLGNRLSPLSHKGFAIKMILEDAIARFLDNEILGFTDFKLKRDKRFDSPS
jgi:hypothetical protein